MSPLYLLGVLLAALGYVNSAAIPPFMKDPDSPEIWELDNLVEPAPNLVMFPHIYNHDRAKAKIPPHDRLKALIKAIIKYDTNHEAGDKRKLVDRTSFHSKSDDPSKKENSSSDVTVQDLSKNEETPMANQKQEKILVAENKLIEGNQNKHHETAEDTTKEELSFELAGRTPSEIEETDRVTHEPNMLVINLKGTARSENPSVEERKSSQEDETKYSLSSYLNKKLEEELEMFKNVVKQEMVLGTEDDKPSENRDDTTENITTVGEPLFESNEETATQIDHTTQKPEVLLEDIVDSIVHIPSIWASDKTHRYTHSIRHGYGVPLQYSHTR